MSVVSNRVPPSKPTGWLKDPTSQKSVDEARQDMLEKRETFRSKITGQEITPSFKQVEGNARTKSAKAETAAPAPVSREDYASELPPQIAAQPPQQSRRAVPTPARVAAPAAQPAPRPAAALPTQSVPAAQPAIAAAPNNGSLHFDLDGGGTMEIFQDPETRLWILEIQQAPDEFGTPGVERFSSRSKDDLLPILGKAKAAASSHIRKQTRLIKAQRIASLESWDTFYATRNLTQAQVNKMDAVSREVLVDGIQVIHIQQFMNEHPTSIINPTTWQPIENFLKKQNAPYTKRNIEYACQELGLQLDAPARVDEPTPAAVVEVSQPVPTAVAPAPAAPEVRKRGTYSSGIRPGQSSAVGGGPSHNEERQPASVETEEQRARRLASTPEGLRQLRAEAIPSLSQARPRR